MPLHTNQTLVKHAVQPMLQHQVDATEPLWEVYGEASTFWFHRLGKAPPVPQSA